MEENKTAVKVEFNQRGAKLRILVILVCLATVCLVFLVYDFIKNKFTIDPIYLVGYASLLVVMATLYRIFIYVQQKKKKTFLLKPNSIHFTDHKNKNIELTSDRLLWWDHQMDLRSGTSFIRLCFRDIDEREKKFRVSDWYGNFDKLEEWLKTHRIKEK